MAATVALDSAGNNSGSSRQRLTGLCPGEAERSSGSELKGVPQLQSGAPQTAQVTINASVILKGQTSVVEETT